MIDNAENADTESQAASTIDKIKARRAAKKPKTKRTPRTKRATTRTTSGSQPNIRTPPPEFENLANTEAAEAANEEATRPSEASGVDKAADNDQDKPTGTVRNRPRRSRHNVVDQGASADDADIDPVEDDDAEAMDDDTWDSATDMPVIDPSYEEQALNLDADTRDEYIAANPELFADPTFVEITPKIAAQLYARRADQQRKVSRSHVQFLSRQMKENYWRFNGDTIRLNEKGGLLDGQHRCLASVDSGCSFGAVVVTVSDKSFETIDTGMRTRAIGELFRMEGHKNWTKLAAAVNCIAEHEAGRKVYYASGQKARRSPLELKALLERHPDLVHSIEMLQKLPPSLGPTAMLAAMHYLFWKRRPEAADKFMEDLGHGAGMSKFDPVMKLRERMMRDRISRAKASKADKYAWIVNAWNARVRGQSMQRLHGQQTGEDPDILG